MRFENWDILLFPQASGTPLQEFRTECYGIVTRMSAHGRARNTNADRYA